MVKKHKNVALVNFKEVERELFEDKDFREAYYSRDEDFELAKMIIRARIQGDKTQKELAEKIKTKQPSIARIESGNYTPSLKILRAVADALNLHLDIRFSDMGGIGVSKYNVKPQVEGNIKSAVSFRQEPQS